MEPHSRRNGLIAGVALGIVVAGLCAAALHFAFN